MNASNIRTAVSVVIPTYNSAECIGRAVDSALNQSHRVLEVIVVDDGGHDDTRSVIQWLSGPIAYHWQPNGGPASARNRGAADARGEWLAFVDADDEWQTTKIEEQLQLAVREGADAVFCSIVQCSDAAEEVVCYRGPTTRQALVRAMLLSNVFSGGASTLLIRRDVFLRLGGFDPSVNGSEDRDFFIRLVDHCPVAYLQRPLLWRRVGPQQYGADPERNRRNGVEILRRHAHRVRASRGAWSLLREARARIFERAGMHYFARGDFPRALPELIRALAIWPFLSNPWKALLNVVTGRRRCTRPERVNTDRAGADSTGTAFDRVRHLCICPRQCDIREAAA